MSKITDEIVANVYSTYPGTRCCIVVFNNVNMEHGWSAKAHPFMERSMPSILRSIADEIEGKQVKKFKRTPKLITWLLGD
jgi:hypothetical protein